MWLFKGFFFSFFGDCEEIIVFSFCLVGCLCKHPFFFGPRGILVSTLLIKE